MSAVATHPRDDLANVRAVVERIAEFAEHSVEFGYLRLLVEKLTKNVDSIEQALSDRRDPAIGHALGGSRVAIERREVGFDATHPMALRRAAYVSALKHTPHNGDFERLRYEQAIVDPDEVLWRQYALARHEAKACAA